MSGINDTDFGSFEAVVNSAVPDKCVGCPEQCHLQGRLAALMSEKRFAETIGEVLVGEPGEEFDAFIEASLPEDIVEEFKGEARKSVGRGIDRIEEEIASTYQEIDVNALSCNGVLKIRATSKEGNRYNMALCNNPRLYVLDSDTYQHLAVHVRVESPKDK
jgi:hypothetical protein